jgi:hypothetical protein
MECRITKAAYGPTIIFPLYPFPRLPLRLEVFGLLLGMAVMIDIVAGIVRNCPKILYFLELRLDN